MASLCVRGVVDQQEAAAAQIAGLRQRDRQGEADRHRRVGGGAALLEEGPPDLAGQGLLGDHQALAGVDRMDAVAGVGEREFGSPRAGPQQEQQGDPAGEEPGQRADGRGPGGHGNLQRWGQQGRG